MKYVLQWFRIISGILKYKIWIYILLYWSTDMCIKTIVKSLGLQNVGKIFVEHTIVTEEKKKPD